MSEAKPLKQIHFEAIGWHYMLVCRELARKYSNQFCLHEALIMALKACHADYRKYTEDEWEEAAIEIETLMDNQLAKAEEFCVNVAPGTRDS